jgi:hypothetical protein
MKNLQKFIHFLKSASPFRDQKYLEERQLLAISDYASCIYSQTLNKLNIDNTRFTDTEQIKIKNVSS